MSTEIHLVGISRDEQRDGGLPPRIVVRISDIGFSCLQDDLETCSMVNPDILRPREEEEPGLHQFLISDPDEFVKLMKNKSLWDSVGYGWDVAIAVLEKDLIDGHQLYWWLVVEY